MYRLSRSFQLVLIFPDNYRLKQSWKFRRKIKLSDVLREEPYILIRTRRHSQCLHGRNRGHVPPPQTLGALRRNIRVRNCNFLNSTLGILAKFRGFPVLFFMRPKVLQLQWYDFGHCKNLHN